MKTEFKPLSDIPGPPRQSPRRHQPRVVAQAYNLGCRSHGQLFRLVRPHQLGKANAEAGPILSGVDHILAGNTYSS